MKNATTEVKLPKTSKLKKVQASTVELVSYSIKAIIPTGSYANIQPEIIVKAKNLEEASAFVLPHIDMLYMKYLNVGMPIAPIITVAPTPDVHGTYPKIPKYIENENISDTTETSVPFQKAEQAIGSCLSMEALQLIEKQITKSVKLNGQEKVTLCAIVSKKADELSGIK